MNKGLLIVIEGIDGAGKSTLAQNLAQKFTSEGHNVVLTKEPGGSTLGKKLRDILQTQPIPITPIAEYLLFAADRAQHIHDVVKPALAQGSIVISDRMADSSLAYQGYGRHVNLDQIRDINTWVMQGVQPDLIFYLKINPKEAANRLFMRNTLTVFEQEKITFVEQLVHGFDEIFQHRHNVITIDATLPPHRITSIAYQMVHSWQHQQ